MGCICSKTKNKEYKQNKQSLETYVNQNNAQTNETVIALNNKDLTPKEDNIPQTKNLQINTIEPSPLFQRIDKIKKLEEIENQEKEDK